MTTHYHKHHKVPKHAGGTDDPSNIELLTVEEHAEAHRLLFEKYGRWQDELAYKALSGQITNYEATLTAIRNTQLGRKHSEETKRKYSEDRKGEKNAFYGKKHTIETKEKISKSHKGMKQSTETKSKYKRKGELNPFYGKTHSEDFKVRQRMNKLGRKDSPETKEKKRIAGLKRYGKIISISS